MKTHSSNRQATFRGLWVMAALAAAATLAACGGTDDASVSVSRELAAQREREAAALQMARSINEQRVAEIKRDRAGRVAQK